MLKKDGFMLFSFYCMKDRITEKPILKFLNDFHDAIYTKTQSSDKLYQVDLMERPFLRERIAVLIELMFNEEADVIFEYENLFDIYELSSKVSNVGNSILYTQMYVFLNDVRTTIMSNDTENDDEHPFKLAYE